MFQTFLPSGNSHVRFYVIIPGSQFLIADWPVYSDAFFFVRFKIQITQPVALSPPHNGSSTYVIPPHPVKPLVLQIGMLRIFDKPMLGFLSNRITGSALFWIMPLDFLRENPAPVFHIPGIQISSRIISVFDHPSPFQNERIEPFFGKFSGSPSTADSCADHDRIVGVALVVLRNIDHI